MNLRPPVPTSDNLPKDEANKQHRAALIPVVVGLIIVLGLAGLSAFNRTGQVEVIPYRTSFMTTNEPLDGMDMYPEEITGDSDAFTPPGSVNDTLMLRPEDSLLVDEPAELAPLPNGRRVGAFVRDQNEITDEFAFWIIQDTSVEDILSHYQMVAGEVNFKPLTPNSPKANQDNQDTTASADPQAAASQSVIFTRDSRPQMKEGRSLPPANDILVVRAKPLADGQIHVTIWYRHARTHAH